MVDIKQKFGEKMRQIRRQKKISQEELAFKASLHRTYISDIERGARNVSLENIEKIAKALEIPMGMLMHSEK
ncbi:MAG: helix-turn-helix transcriptional regulator [bacterium]|nr:helix-turn-helix transcriptional regulator [bacterium]